MDINNLKIIPPEGMEYYIENGEIRFRKAKKNLTYNDIAAALFETNKTYYFDVYANIKCANGVHSSYWQTNNCTSERQAQKLLAINKLMNVAKYLNGKWKPDWDNMEEDKFYIRYNQASRTLQVGAANILYSDIVYFKSGKLAKQAIEILGEETIKLALCTDW